MLAWLWLVACGDYSVQIDNTAPVEVSVANATGSAATVPAGETASTSVGRTGRVAVREGQLKGAAGGAAVQLTALPPPPSGSCDHNYGVVSFGPGVSPPDTLCVDGYPKGYAPDAFVVASGTESVCGYRNAKYNPLEGWEVEAWCGTLAGPVGACGSEVIIQNSSPGQGPVSYLDCSVICHPKSNWSCL